MTVARPRSASDAARIGVAVGTLFGIGIVQLLGAVAPACPTNACVAALSWVPTPADNAGETMLLAFSGTALVTAAVAASAWLFVRSERIDDQHTGGPA